MASFTYASGPSFATRPAPGRSGTSFTAPTGNGAWDKLVDTANRLVIRATSPELEDVDWDWMARIVDFIKFYAGAPGIAQILKAFKRQWRTGNRMVQKNVLAGVDFCITFVGRPFSARLAGAELWRELKDCTKYRAKVKPSVYELLTVYVRAWAFNKGSVPEIAEFFEKLKGRGYAFPQLGAYDVLRPPRYIPLNQRTDDAVKVELLDKSQRETDADETMSIAGEEHLDVIQEEEEDTIVAVREPSADLFNLLDLDWDDTPAPKSSDEATHADPFAASEVLAAGNSGGNPFGDVQPEGPAPGVVNPFADAPAGAIPANVQPTNNPFGSPYMGAPAVRPMGVAAGPIPEDLFNPMPGMAQPATTDGTPAFPGFSTPGVPSFGAPTVSAFGAAAQQPFGTQPAPVQPGNVSEMLAAIPPPANKDPLSELLG